MVIEKKHILETISVALERRLDQSDLTKRMEDLEINSIIFVKIVIQCELKFSFEFENEMLVLNKFENLDAFVNYILKMVIKTKK